MHEQRKPNFRLISRRFESYWRARGHEYFKRSSQQAGLEGSIQVSLSEIIFTAIFHIGVFNGETGLLSARLKSQQKEHDVRGIARLEKNIWMEVFLLFLCFYSFCFQFALETCWLKFSDIEIRIRIILSSAIWTKRKWLLYIFFFKETVDENVFEIVNASNR